MYFYKFRRNLNNLKKNLKKTSGNPVQKYELTKFYDKKRPIQENKSV